MLRGEDLTAGLIKTVGIFERARRRARAVPRSFLWLLSAVLLGALLSRTDLAATGGLFQSPPESPLATPTQAPTVVPTAIPTETTAATATAVPPDEGPTETVAPESSPTLVPPTPTATVQVPAATPTPTATATATPTPTAVIPTATAVPSATSTPTPSSAGGGERYPEGESNLLFDWSMLVDSLALGLSYAWLCCGVIVLLGLAALFVALWAASKRREQGEE
jgi:hypothetical protein